MRLNLFKRASRAAYRGLRPHPLCNPGQTFLMVAIRNLYWTERISTFIVLGLILASKMFRVGGAVPGGVASQVLNREWRSSPARLIHRSNER
jgi:hypothetical protein